MGFENKMMKKFPWYSSFDPANCKYPNDPGKDFTEGYACMEFNAVTGVDPDGNPIKATTLTKGYDPTLRSWYQKAKDKASDETVIFSDPYKGASKGLAMITVAKAVNLGVNPEIKGVIGIDIYIQTLADSVLNAKILNDGYTYMIDKQLNLIMHPEFTDMS